MKTNEIKEAVREQYADHLKDRQASGCCCSKDVTPDIARRLYDDSNLQGLDAELLKTSFGCGNPTQIARLIEGETVVDLGSGAGLDALIAARVVGPSGKVVGIDMTDEMLEAARSNQRDAGIENAEFVKGDIERIPLDDECADVVISNCVINLSTDKQAVLNEAFRILKSGGRFAVTDIVVLQPLPAKVAENLDMWSGCVSGALLESEYKRLLEEAGFTSVAIEHLHEHEPDTQEMIDVVDSLTETEREAFDGSVVSAAISAIKVPASSPRQGS